MTFQKLKDKFNAVVAPMVNMTAEKAGQLLFLHAAGLFALNELIIKHPPMDPVKLTLIEMALPALLGLQGAVTGALLGNSISSLKNTNADRPQPSSIREYFNQKGADIKQGLHDMKNPAKVGAIVAYGLGALLSVGMSFTTR
ncbi:MAG TPA: hypothetical protein VL625_13130 [Patescibacteria group bacterium]|nr:hypothetical protein [Patescibacteria group bacterium]